MVNAEMVKEAPLVVKPASPLKKRRTDFGLTQRNVAEAVEGLSRDSLVAIEAGEQWPTASQILGLTRFYRRLYPELRPCDVCREALEGWAAFRGINLQDEEAAS
jgi:DNA-binding XRE family transcriptional regulator